MSKPKVSKLFIYPLKSLDPIELTETTIGVHSLKHDRTFAMMGEDGRYVNGKRTGRVNQLKATYDLENGLIHLTPRSKKQVETFELNINNRELNKYLEDFFELKLHLVHSEKGELLDVPFSSSATIISTATYKSLQQDLPKHSLDDLRLRFRANIEIEGVDAFWEEQLINSPTTAVKFTIGNVNMIGITPRDRCNVPPRDPLTGDTDKTFIKSMMASRANSLPSDSKLPLFGNNYHLCVDTYLPPTETGKTIKIGDEIKLGAIINIP